MKKLLVIFILVFIMAISIGCGRIFAPNVDVLGVVLNDLDKAAISVINRGEPCKWSVKIYDLDGILCDSTSQKYIEEIDSATFHIPSTEFIVRLFVTEPLSMAEEYHSEKSYNFSSKFVIDKTIVHLQENCHIITLNNLDNAGWGKVVQISIDTDEVYEQIFQGNTGILEISTPLWPNVIINIYSYQGNQWILTDQNIT